MTTTIHAKVLFDKKQYLEILIVNHIAYVRSETYKSLRFNGVLKHVTSSFKCIGKIQPVNSLKIENYTAIFRSYDRRITVFKPSNTATARVTKFMAVKLDEPAVKEINDGKNLRNWCNCT